MPFSGHSCQIDEMMLTSSTPQRTHAGHRQVRQPPALAAAPRTRRDVPPTRRPIHRRVQPTVASSPRVHRPRHHHRRDGVDTTVRPLGQEARGPRRPPSRLAVPFHLHLRRG